MCAIEGCDKKSASSQGWCKMHYTRWKRHGDPEKTNLGYVPKYLHDVILEYDGDDCLFWPFTKNSNGYPQLRMDGKICYAHRLVCEAHNGPAPTDKHEATHSCGNGHLGCVTKRHLGWKTHAENMEDKYVHGTNLLGERVGTSKLTADQVVAIRKTDLSNAKTAKMFGVSATQVHRIRAGTRWSWLAAE